MKMMEKQVILEYMIWKKTKKKKLIYNIDKNST